MKIKVLITCKWAQPEPHLPHLVFEAGDEAVVRDHVAARMISAGYAVAVNCQITDSVTGNQDDKSGDEGHEGSENKDPEAQQEEGKIEDVNPEGEKEPEVQEGEKSVEGDHDNKAQSNAPENKALGNKHKNKNNK